MKMMKQCAIFTLILAAFCLLLVPAQAAEIVASGECGAEGSNLTWTLDADGLLTISGTGAMEDFTNAEVWYQSNAPWFSVRDSVLQVVIQPGVTTVGDYAFYNCFDIQSVTLPDGITKIGESAFYGCHKMSDCNIPSSVTELGNNCFAYSGITSAEIPYGITTVTSFFYNCIDLKSVTIPNSVTTIGGGAFYWCSSLESLIIPDSVTSIGENMCLMCERLEYVYLGKGVNGITSTTFNYCGSLKKFEVSPENPYYCTDEYGVLFNKDMTELIQAPAAMTGIYYVPDGVVTLRDMAFCRNTGLTGVVLSDSVREIGSWSLGYSKMTQITLNEGLTTIADGAFRYAEKLESIEIPGTVTEIGTYIFQYCYGLKSVTLGEGITCFPECMFLECESLEEITIPASITDIGSSCLEYFPSLKTVHYGGTRIQWDLFNVKLDSSVTVLTHNHSFSGNTCTGCGLVGGHISTQLAWFVDRGILMFEGIGAIPDYSLTSPAPWYRLRGEISQVEFSASVTDIGDYAFYGFENITEITLPAQATYVGDHAFEDCIALTSVSLPNQVVSIGNYAFEGCIALKSVSLPDQVVSIGNYAFANCTTMRTVYFGASVSSIDQGTFFNCPQISSYQVSAGNPYYAQYSVYGSTEYPYLFTKDLKTVVLSPRTVSGNIKIPYGVTTIANDAFADCTKVTNIMLPNTVTTIGKNVFAGCTALTGISYAGTEAQWQQVSVDQSNALTQDMVFCIASPEHTLYDGCCTGCNVWGGICGAQGFNMHWTLDPYGTMHIFGTGAMADFSSYSITPWYAHRKTIQFVTIDSGVTTIGKNAFSDASNLKTISIPDTITSVGANAFSSCSGLQYAISNNGKYLGNADNLYLVLAGMTSSCTTFEVHSATKLIASFAFSNSVESIVIPANVAHINESAFSSSAKPKAILVDEENPWYCSDPSGVLFNKDMTRLIKAPVGSLTSYTIPDSVTTISENAFVNGTSLKSVYISTNLRAFEGNSFQYCNNLTVYYLGTQEQWRQIEGYADITATKQYNACVITRQPKAVTVKKGEYAQFAVKAIGLDLTYAWQYSADGGKTWKAADDQGYNTATLTVLASFEQNGYLYRCKITNAAGTVKTSNTAKLTLEVTPVAFVAHPQAETVKLGNRAAFTVETEGEVKAYQWQYQMVENGPWWNCTQYTMGYNTTVLNVIAAEKRQGFLYRCRITDMAGKKYYSNTAELTVDIPESYAVLSQPQNAWVMAGKKTTFHVDTQGEGLTYQWEYHKGVDKTGPEYYWIAMGSTTGCKTDTLTIAGISGATNRDGWAYRCVITDANGYIYTTEHAFLYVAAAQIDSQPENQTVTNTGKAKFQVEVSGSVASYQWQYSKDGGKSWYNSSSATQGYNTATLTVAGVSGSTNRNGFLYRCIIIDADGNRIESQVAMLTVK